MKTYQTLTGSFYATQKRPRASIEPRCGAGTSSEVQRFGFNDWQIQLPAPRRQRRALLADLLEAGLCGRISALFQKAQPISPLGARSPSCAWTGIAPQSWLNREVVQSIPIGRLVSAAGDALSQRDAAPSLLPKPEHFTSNNSTGNERLRQCSPYHTLP